MRQFIDIVALMETPLADLQTFGEPLDKEGSFSKQDRDFMAKAIEKNLYMAKLTRFPAPLYVYIINQKGLAEIGERYPEQEVTDWDKFYNRYNRKIDSPIDLKVFSEVRKAIKRNKAADPKGIHFVMGDNYSFDDQMRPTPWIIVHRFLHCVFRILASLFEESFDDYCASTIAMERLTSAFDFASVRSGKVTTSELNIEIATQYLVTGKTTFDWGRFEKNLQNNLKKLSYESEKKKIVAATEAYCASVHNLMKCCQGKTFYI